MEEEEQPQSEKAKTLFFNSEKVIKNYDVLLKRIYDLSKEGLPYIIVHVYIDYPVKLDKYMIEKSDWDSIKIKLDQEKFRIINITNGTSSNMHGEFRILWI